MDFTEFFKKKRIDLTALEQGEPALFSEFKIHYEQMGEKSFDHTKKYWFNKIRRQFPLAPEVKTEKAHIPNPVAEQTITESLTETTTPPAPKLGFVPKFKMGNLPKPAVKTEEEKEKPADVTASENIAEEKPAETTETKPAGYVPRFKMKPKPETDVAATPEAADAVPAKDEAPSPEGPPVKPAYKPRFNMNKIPPKETE